MPIIDAQVHCYERDHSGRPWVEVLTGPPEVTGDDMVKAMDDVGVNGAILVSVWTMYRYDDSLRWSNRSTRTTVPPRRRLPTGRRAMGRSACAS